MPCENLTLFFTMIHDSFRNETTRHKRYLIYLTKIDAQSLNYV